MIVKEPEMVKRICAWCKNPFMARRADTSFCSPRCRQLSSRWRRRLPALERQAEMILDAIGVYLQYEDTRHAAKGTLYRLIARAQKKTQKPKGQPS